MRPFYPGGDYQKEKYKPGAVVVDNPPFSIFAEIVKFYQEKKIKFFLFGPHLTMLGIRNAATFVITGVQITYENGANVNTSFVTNLEPEKVRLRSAPTLYKALKEANDKNLKEMHKELPKYTYPLHVVTAAMIAPYSRLGIDFVVTKAESMRIAELDEQKARGRAIFGGGYLVSDRIAAEREKAEREKAEREKAEREKAEREKAERWSLSERERAIIEELNKKAKQ